ncbi:MAG: GNAT family acetyltransferase [Gammaproteobacteria bacterium]|jgi:ribosomal protein S18 acetylase RimI-like enzyme|nr:GNAT family acetyltransferase [Gammaproteobacteria bacterium]
MNPLAIRPFRPADENAVVALWEECGLLRRWNDPRKDIRRKLRVQSELFLVGELDGRIVASAMAGYDGHRGWLNYLAVAPALRGRGLARGMMESIERSLANAGCPKLNIQVRSDNVAAIGFYRRLGYRLDDVVGLGKRLEPDD